MHEAAGNDLHQRVASSRASNGSKYDLKQIRALWTSQYYFRFRHAVGGGLTADFYSCTDPDDFRELSGWLCCHVLACLLFERVSAPVFSSVGCHRASSGTLTSPVPTSDLTNGLQGVDYLWATAGRTVLDGNPVGQIKHQWEAARQPGKKTSCESSAVLDGGHNAH